MDAAAWGMHRAARCQMLFHRVAELRDRVVFDRQRPGRVRVARVRAQLPIGPRNAIDARRIERLGAPSRRTSAAPFVTLLSSFGAVASVTRER
jgi:hypothetical protein